MKEELNQLKKWILLPFFLLFLFSCNKSPDHSPVIEKEINLSGFTKIYAGERFNLIITKGNSFYIKVKGPADTVNDIDWNVSNNILDIQYTHYVVNRPKADVIINLPALIQVNLAGAATGTINGFQGVNNVIRTVLSGASGCTLNGTGINTQIDISGASELNVNGSTESLYGNISGAGKLNASDLTSTEVDIAASGGSEAKVKVVTTLFAEATGGSSIYYKGSPTVKNIQTSGGGRVIQQ
jgi:Putative auto-transporter adhesin, head GIN domain